MHFIVFHTRTPPVFSILGAAARSANLTGALELYPRAAGRLQQLTAAAATGSVAACAVKAPPAPEPEPEPSPAPSPEPEAPPCGGSDTVIGVWLLGMTFVTALVLWRVGVMREEYLAQGPSRL